MSEPTPLSAEHVSPETWKLLQNAFPAYQDEQLDFVIGLERFQRSALTKLAHWVNPDPECDHCYAAWAQWASEGDGPFTFAQIAYWNTSEVTSGFERRLFATIDAQAAEIAALKGAQRTLDWLDEGWEFPCPSCGGGCYRSRALEKQHCYACGAAFPPEVLRMLAGKEAQG